MQPLSAWKCRVLAEASKPVSFCVQGLDKQGANIFIFFSISPSPSKGQDLGHVYHFIAAFVRQYIHECSFKVNHCTDFLYKTLISADPLNPLPGNLLVKYMVFVARATLFFPSAQKQAFYDNGGKGRFR